MNYSVVILSKDGAKACICVRHVLVAQPDLNKGRIIVVDDGMGSGFRRTLVDDGITVIDGVKPFIFARNANLGIKFADHYTENMDVILLNDDALLETPNGFGSLHKFATDLQDEYGLMATITDSVGNRNQFATKADGFWESRVLDEPRMVCFICVYIPRRTIDLIGGLDERFDGYGWEDNAYCELVKRAGLKIGIYTGCFVNHTKLKSSFRTTAAGNRDAFERGQAIFQKYYGGHT